MKFDEGPIDQEKELSRMWQESSLQGPMDDGQLLRKIAASLEGFDRKIQWRNLREYIAGGALIAWFVWLSFNPATRLLAVGGIIAVGFVMIYLWRNSRQTPPLDPAADVRSYHAALLERYDRQIQLLRRVKYWYVLPLYLWMLLVMTSGPARPVKVRIAYFVGVTLFAGFVVWLNEGYGVRKLRAARKSAEALLAEREE